VAGRRHSGAVLTTGMLNVGIVGLGRMGQRHAEQLALHTPGARLVAACSVDAGRTLAHGHETSTEVIGTEGSDADRRSDHEVVAERPGGGSGVRPGFDRLADVTRSG